MAQPTGVSYTKADSHYFEKRGLQRYAGIWSLWALGVGAVISGHFSGWNFGFATGGWGGLLVAGIIIAIMYGSLVFCIAGNESGSSTHGCCLFIRPHGHGSMGRVSSPVCAKTSSMW